MAPEHVVLGLLTSLVDKHLVAPLPVGDAEPRFGMLGTIRQFALEQAEIAQETTATRAAHAAWMLEIADSSRAAIDTAAEGAWFDRLEIEHDNFRSTLDWASREQEKIATFVSNSRRHCGRSGLCVAT